MDKDMFQIPYIAHAHRMYLAHRRETVLKILLGATNAAWIAAAIVYFALR